MPHSHTSIVSRPHLGRTYQSNLEYAHVIFRSSQLNRKHNMTLPKASIAEVIESSVRIPRIVITYCVRCKWLLRAAYVRYQICFCSSRVILKHASLLSCIPSYYTTYPSWCSACLKKRYVAEWRYYVRARRTAKSPCIPFSSFYLHVYMLSGGLVEVAKID